MHAAKACGRLHTLEAPHRPDPLFAASMVLLLVIIQIPVRAMAHGFPQDNSDGTRIGVGSITGNSLRDTTGDGAGGAKEGFCRCLVPLLTEQDIHEVPISIAA